MDGGSLRLWACLALAGAAGCATESRPSDVVLPLQLSDGAFLTHGPRFAAGLSATVRLCADSLGRMTSATVVVSSGEKRFDDFIVDYARRVQVLKPQRRNGRPVAGCSTVDVEINHPSGPGTSGGEQSALG
jgi:hypothetical protein